MRPGLGLGLARSPRGSPALPVTSGLVPRNQLSNAASAMTSAGVFRHVSDLAGSGATWAPKRAPNGSGTTSPGLRYSLGAVNGLNAAWCNNDVDKGAPCAARPWRKS
jgi:hypothetical protein